MTTSHSQPKQTYDGVTDLVPAELFFVQGITGEYFTTKLAAEVRARKAFPHESEDKRYARIFFKRFFKEV